MADEEHPPNGSSPSSMFRAQVARIEGRMDKYDGLLAELPAIRVAVDGLTKAIRDQAVAAADERRLLRDDIAEKTRELHARIDADKSGRVGNLRFIATVVSVVIGGFVAVFSVSTFGINALQKPNEIETKAAQKLLEIQIEHQKDLGRVAQAFAEKIDKVTAEIRTREIARFDGQIASLQATMNARAPVLQALRDDINSNRALMDERNGLLLAADDELVSMIRSSMKFATDSATELRGEIQDLARQVIELQGRASQP